MTPLAQRVASRYLANQGLKRTATEEIIVIHTHRDDTYVDVTTVNNVTPISDLEMVGLPNGDTLTFAKSVQAIKTNADLANDNRVPEALFNAGLIETDDAGNYIW